MTGGKLSRVPNQPKTPQHSVRAPQDEWDEWAALADAEGLPLSEVIRREMRRYAKREQKKRAK
jgi:hypothetical protein